MQQLLQEQLLMLYRPAVAAPAAKATTANAKQLRAHLLKLLHLEQRLLLQLKNRFICYDGCSCCSSSCIYMFPQLLLLPEQPLNMPSSSKQTCYGYTAASSHITAAVAPAVTSSSCLAATARHTCYSRCVSSSSLMLQLQNRLICNSCCNCCGNSC